MAKKSKKMDKMLFEETKKRLQNIMEYTTFNNAILGEDDDDQQDDGMGPDPMGGDMPPQGGPDMGGAPAGPDPMGGGMPPQGDPGMGGAPMDGGMPPQGDPGMGGGPQGFDPQMPPQDGGDMGGDPNGGGMPPQGGPDMGGAPMDDGMPMDGEGPSPEDDVVDITDLTDAQDATAQEIENLGNKFSAVLKKLSSFEDLIKANDAKIEDIKTEFERRNPTQIEKLSMNTAKGGPFTVNPEEYWDEKEATSNYSRDDDDNGKEQGQYVITADDVNGDVNWKSIADTLDDDFLMHQNLNNVLKF